MLEFINSELYNLVFFSLCCVFVCLTAIAFFYATLNQSTEKEIQGCERLENKQYKEFLEYIKEKQRKNNI